MKISLKFYRSSLLIVAALLVAVAVLIAVGIIPPVKNDTFPRATPERAVPAFFVNVVYNLVVAVVLGVIGFRTTGRSRWSTIVLWSVGLLTLLFAYALNDAAFAYRGHGPALHTATILLHFCSVADLVAALVALIAALFLPKQA
jgi:quinol-cytochrome oxidoreductase complex cytochrome b subunit